MQADTAVKGRPHLLYVAWGFPPSRGAGVYRALATANMFAAEGWDVTVLTASREVFEYQTGTDPELESRIDPRITVVRVPFNWDRGQPDLAKWSRTRVASNLLWTYTRSQRDRVAFPEAGYGSWRRSLVAATERVHREKPVNLVIGTANPNVDFTPGWHLNRNHKIPYVMDYRDTWHLDVYRDKRIGSPRSRSARMERRLLRNAAEAWFVNAPIRDWHAANYPERAEAFHVVANGFDQEFARQFVDHQPQRNGEATGLTFGYLGTMYGPMPLRESLEGWRLARSTSALMARSRLVIRGRLGHYAEPDPALLGLLEEYRHDGVTYEGAVSKTQVAEVYRTFDVLLLILGRSKYVTSGKVFEYAATGLPIVSLHHPDTASTGILAGHPDWFPAEELSGTHIARLLTRAGESAVAASPEKQRLAREWADHLSRENQLHPRILDLQALVGGSL